MEPISIFGVAAAASQVAEQGMSLSSYILDAASKIRKAPQLMEAAAIQVQLSAEALDRLAEALRRESAYLTVEYYNDASFLVEKCRDIYTEMRWRISRNAEKGPTSWSQRVKWAFKTDKRLSKLNRDLKIWEEVLRKHLSVPDYRLAYTQPSTAHTFLRAAMINAERSVRGRTTRAIFREELQRRTAQALREQASVTSSRSVSPSSPQGGPHERHDRKVQSASEDFRNQDDFTARDLRGIKHRSTEDDATRTMHRHPADETEQEPPMSDDDSAGSRYSQEIDCQYERILSTATAALIIRDDLAIYLEPSRMPAGYLDEFDLSTSHAIKYDTLNHHTIRNTGEHVHGSVVSSNGHQVPQVPDTTAFTTQTVRSNQDQGRPRKRLRSRARHEIAVSNNEQDSTPQAALGASRSESWRSAIGYDDTNRYPYMRQTANPQSANRTRTYPAPEVHRSPSTTSAPRHHILMQDDSVYTSAPSDTSPIQRQFERAGFDNQHEMSAFDFDGFEQEGTAWPSGPASFQDGATSRPAGMSNAAIVRRSGH